MMRFMLMHAPGAGRDEIAAGLVRALGDQGVAVEVVRDDEHAGPWPTARRAWALGHRFGEAWVVVLQDDIVLCHDAGAGSGGIVLRGARGAPTSV